VGVTVRQTEVETSVVVRYGCEACDLQRDAKVESYGIYKLPFGDEEDAEAGATNDAVERARDTIMFVPCPACGHRQSGRREVFVQTSLRFAFATIVGGVGLGVAMQVRGEDDDVVLWTAVAGLVFLAVISSVTLLTWKRHPWIRATERTHFSADTMSPDPRLSEQHQRERAELRATKKKVLLALLFSLTVGGIVAAVQLASAPKTTQAVASPPAPTTSSVEPSLPSPASLAYPLRHQLAVGDARIDVVEGVLEVGPSVGPSAREHVRLRKPWVHRTDLFSFEYDPTLTAIARDEGVLVYGDAGSVWIAPSSTDDKRSEAIEELEERWGVADTSYDDVTRQLGRQARRGRLRSLPSGDVLEMFAPKLDSTTRVAIVIRLTGSESPTLASLLASLTEAPVDRAPHYMTIVGKRVMLHLDEPTLLHEDRIAATLTTRSSFWRMVAGRRIEHPADVAVLSRNPRGKGMQLVFLRDGVELIVAPQNDPLDASQALALLEDGVSETTPVSLTIGPTTLAGLRRDEPRPIEAYAFETPRSGWLAVAIVHQDRAAATGLAASVLELL
jgi:hypothetical protein